MSDKPSRTQGHRARLRRAGGRLVQVALSPAASVALDVLALDHGSITGAVEAAILGAATKKSRASPAQ